VTAVLHIATCRPLPEPDPDEALLLTALEAVGVEARMVAWNDPDAWQGGDALIRSTWDYVHHLDQFLKWIDRVAALGRLWNPAPVLRRNVHKRYLLELAAAGVAVTPTVLVPRGATDSLRTLAAARGWRDVVLKPAVGAGSFDTHRVRDAATPEAQALFARLVGERESLVQPYLDSVDDHGERALVWIDGEFTHAVRKTPRFAADDEQVSPALPLAAAERALGEHALEVALRLAGVTAEDLLYARVDVAPDASGRPVLMELELVEPSLFLLQNPRALQRFVAAIAARVT
jgi:glutathione synthase/RimK-type ligase-like ATP-grasp enzyme